MELTDRAETLWASFEAEVRRRLAGRSDVNVADVLAGVREHVEAELSRRGVETVTGEELSEVLEQVGGPGQWDDAVADPGAGSPATGAASGLPPTARWPGVAALVSALLGTVLILLGSGWAWAPGWALLVAGVILARVSLEHDDPESGTEARPGPTRRLTLILWWAASAVGTLAVVILPAVLVWAAAQIGGPLEAVLPGRPGVPGSPAPLPGYWRMPVLIGGSATAVWWMLLAAVAARFGDGIRRLLGPARALAPEAAPRALTVGVGVLVLASLAFAVAGCAGPAAGAPAGPAAAAPRPALPVRTAVARADVAAVDSARSLLRAAARAGAGIAVAVYRAGEPVWVEGVGYADVEAGAPVDPTTTRFRLYSVAKPMTAAAAGRLMEARRLNPAAPIQTYVPDYPSHDPPITAMALATHTSGIRHYADDAEANSRRHCATVADALPIFENDPLVHPPGAGETYSSWGFVALSAVIEGAADTSFTAAMDRLVFQPAGMTGVALDDPTRQVPGRAAFYEEVDGELRPAPAVDNTCKWGAGAFLGTAPDLAAFGAAMLDGSLLSERTLQLFFRGRDTYVAQGVGAGGVAFLMLDRANDLAVAVVANAVGEAAGPAAQRAFEGVYGGMAGR